MISLRGLANAGTAAVAGYGEGQLQGQALSRQIELTREQQERQALMDLFRARLETARTNAETRNANRPIPLDPLSPEGIAAQVALAKGLKAAGVNKSGGVPRPAAPRQDIRVTNLNRAITEAQQAVRDAEGQVARIQTSGGVGKTLFDQGAMDSPLARAYSHQLAPANITLKQARDRLAGLQTQRDAIANITGSSTGDGSDDGNDDGGDDAPDATPAGSAPTAAPAPTPGAPVAKPAAGPAPTAAQASWDALAQKYGVQRTTQEIGPRP